MNRVKSSMSKCLLFSVMALFGCTDVPDELRNEAEGKCNGRAYTEYQFCANGQVYNLCGGLPFNPSIVDCCNNHQYTISTEFCSQNNIYRKCGGRDYNPELEFCGADNIAHPKCGVSTYNSATQFCYDNSVYSKCNGETYNPSNQRCESSVIKSECGTNWYNPETQFCYNNSVYGKCNGRTYNPSEQRCQSGVVETKCGTSWYNYDTSTQFCSGSSVYDKCGGQAYSPTDQRCSASNVIETKCGSDWYNPSTQFCQSGTNTVKNFCGTATYVSTEYCSNGTVKNYDGFITDSRGGKKYNTTVIDGKTWMAENLNYNASGSKCGNGNGLSDANTATCDTYGRLYNWATAMALDNSCNTNTCDSQVNANHRGICPEGWHIPSNAEWSNLMLYVNPDCSWNLVNCEYAGTKLKSASGWSENWNFSGNGTDEFGFSALPGGYGNSNGYFDGVGYYGSWWPATENSADGAYGRGMRYDNPSVETFDYTGSYSGNYMDKAYLRSVRCVQD